MGELHKKVNFNIRACVDKQMLNQSCTAGVFLAVAFINGIGSLLDTFQGANKALFRGAIMHNNNGSDIVARHVRENLKARNSAGNRAKGENQYRTKRRQGHVAVAHALF